MGGSESKPRTAHPSSHDHESSSSRTTSRYSPYQTDHVRPETIAKLQKKYSKIDDDFNSLSQVVCQVQIFVTSLLI